ncbi:MAG: SCO6880 family protein [Solirubrobacteraceae bacterium]
MSERLSYRFGPLERRGLLGPLRGGQAITVTAGAVVAIAVLDGSPSVMGALIALVAFLASVGTATLPVGRRTTEEWVPLLAHFAARRLRGAHRFRSSVPANGWRAPAAGRRLRAVGNGPGGGRAAHATAPPPAPDPPAQLRDVRVGTARYRDRPIGVVSERSGRRLTAVLACRVVSFMLLDPDAQERRLARWGHVLSGAAGTPIRRIQWLERTAPAQGDELARWLHAERDPSIPPRGTAMVESYLELIGTTARVTQEHEILVAVQVDSQRVRDRGPDALQRTLIEETERVAEGLVASEVTVLGALSEGQLARALRTAFDPFARAELATLEAADSQRDGLSEVNAWPLGTEEAWDHFRSDGAVHATYWIGGWPRIDVSATFLDSLLGRSNAVRTVAVTFEPVAPERSTREVEAAVTRDRADRELRRRFGQSETARQRQSAEATLRREAELAAGHCEVRLSGFVTVSGRDPEDLRRSCSQVLEHAARARLELHRMYGQQADAFAFTLPLCRGLR